VKDEEDNLSWKVTGFYDHPESHLTRSEYECGKERKFRKNSRSLETGMRKMILVFLFLCDTRYI
jgi:hypothetical protein